MVFRRLEILKELNDVAFLVISIGFLGLIIGSFLNVVIYRIPRGESIVYPNSHCPHCGQFLKPLDIVPVVSFLVQKGRCRYCREEISWRYPLVEILTGISFAYGGWISGAEPATLIIKLIFIALLITLAFIDIDTFRLPDVLVYPIIFLGVIGAGTGILEVSLAGSVASALGAGGLFWLIAKIYPKGMGLGDVKLVAGLGAFLGFPLVFWAIFMASLSGVMVGGLTLLLKGKDVRDPIPFGPYLAFGAIITLFWGDLFSTWLH